MLFAKLEVAGHGQFWFEVGLRDNLQAEQFAAGVAAGWGLGRREPARIVDIRLSKHPSEPLRTMEQLQEFLSLDQQEPGESV